MMPKYPTLHEGETFVHDDADAELTIQEDVQTAGVSTQDLDTTLVLVEDDDGDQFRVGLQQFGGRRSPWTPQESYPR